MPEGNAGEISLALLVQMWVGLESKPLIINELLRNQVNHVKEIRELNCDTKTMIHRKHDASQDKKT